MKYLINILCLFICLIIFSCSTTKEIVVEDIGSGTSTLDFTKGDYADVARKFSKSILFESWVKRSEEPFLIDMGEIKDNTDGRIELKKLQEELAKSFEKTDKFKFIKSENKLLLYGSVEYKPKKKGEYSYGYYIFDFSVASIDSNKVLWADEVEIKKIIKTKP